MTRWKLDLDTTAGVDSGSVLETMYTPNIGNQLSSRTAPGLLSVGGTSALGSLMAVGAPVETSAGSAVRVGPYYHRAIPVGNSSSMIGVDATVVALVSGSPSRSAVDVRRGVVPKASVDFSYDEAGNMTSDGELAYSWDNLGRLNEVSRNAEAVSAYGAALQQRYRYDADGQRVEKQYLQGEGAGRCTRYVYDGMDVVAEVEVALNSSGAVSSSALSKTYHWTPTGTGRAGRLLEMVDRTNGRAALAGYDGRGNLTTWTDARTGALLGGRDYDPFGQVWYETWSDTGAQSSFGKTGYGFSTEYRDETGLVYYGFRYYKPELGRIISRDPAGEAGSGVNLYAFGGNDPVNNRELYGLTIDEETLRSLQEYFAGNTGTFEDVYLPPGLLHRILNIYAGDPVDPAKSNLLKPMYIDGKKGEESQTGGRIWDYFDPFANVGSRATIASSGNSAGGGGDGATPKGPDGSQTPNKPADDKDPCARAVKQLGELLNERQKLYADQSVAEDSLSQAKLDLRHANLAWAEALTLGLTNFLPTRQIKGLGLSADDASLLKTAAVDLHVDAFQLTRDPGILDYAGTGLDLTETLTGTFRIGVRYGKLAGRASGVLTAAQIGWSAGVFGVDYSEARNAIDKASGSAGRAGRNLETNQRDWDQLQKFIDTHCR